MSGGGRPDERSSGDWKGDARQALGRSPDGSVFRFDVSSLPDVVGLARFVRDMRVELLVRGLKIEAGTSESRLVVFVWGNRERQRIITCRQTPLEGEMFWCWVWQQPDWGEKFEPFARADEPGKAADVVVEVFGLREVELADLREEFPQCDIQALPLGRWMATYPTAEGDKVLTAPNTAELRRRLRRYAGGEYVTET